MRQIDDLMREYRGDVPGACVAVLRGGVAVLRRAYGLADLEGGVAAELATNFRLASLTKQFTSAAILLLRQDGRVGLEDSVRKWLPGLPSVADSMTVRHLLTHTSGLLDYEELIPEGTTSQLRDTDVLRLLEAEDRSHFPPGTQYRYSNSGYALLALIVEHASGEDFASYLRTRVFLPLGMRNTVAFEAGVSVVAQRAFGYSAAGRSWARTDQSLTSATLGDGGIYSSVEDLAKWDAGLYGGGPLQPQSIDLAFEPATATDDPAVQYGFGWRISGETRWHSGETLGFRNVIVRWLQHRLTVIVLTNRNDPAPCGTARAIAESFLRGDA